MHATSKNALYALALLATLGLPVAINGQLTITQSSFSSGGSSTSGGTTLQSSVGQPVVGTSSNGGSATLFSGFLSPSGSGPLEIDLISFSAEIPEEGTNPIITWETANELDNAGFRVYRAVGTPGNWSFGEELTSGLIIGQGSEVSGAAYSFVDPDPFLSGDSIRWYFMTDLDLSGKVTVHGPVKAIDNTSITSVIDWTIFHD